MLIAFPTFAIALLKTFAPMIVPMLVVYRMQRAGGTLVSKFLSCALAMAAAFAVYTALVFAMPMNMGAPPFSVASLLVVFGYALAGALGGLAVARRLRFEPPPPKTFSS